ncbi:IS110 family transposase [Wukongibacter sp. M2B1]|uniref:IS110 family transposase n=1 Tax=Wukongibacter sp. M2B1 TaxID=3088895 RepID=UPI003D796A07
MRDNCPVVGVGIAKNFCYYCVLAPTGDTYLKPFKALNTKEGLKSVLKKIEKVEKAFSKRPVIVLESTVHYSNRLVHFFIKNGLKVFLINPLLSHSIKNSTVRKVKTDKVDALELAKLYFIKDLREFKMSSTHLENLKVLSRTYCKLSEQRTSVSNQLTATVEQVMPDFNKIFSRIISKAALEILINYPSPDAVLNAPKNNILDLIKTFSKRGTEYAVEKHKNLLKCATDAKEIGIDLSAYYEIIVIYAKHLKHLNEQLGSIDKKINELAIHIPQVELISSIPGIGERLAPIITSEIGNIDRFNNSKQLVAYCGIDPSVRQSGNFVGTKNRLTKRGSPYIRRALYIAATIAIRKNPNGTYVNKVIYDYYQEKIKSKSKKQSLGAIMNKLVRIIFSVLKNKRLFVLITPEEQKKMYLRNMKIVA